MASESSLPKLMACPRKLVLFSRVSFPPGTFGGYIGQGQWLTTYVLPPGCVDTRNCKVIAHGRIWIDPWDDEQGKRDAPPERITGKYEIDLNGKHFKGHFAVQEKRRTSAESVRVCM